MHPDKKTRKMSLKNYLSRRWFETRIGYGYYLALPIGLATAISVQYHFVIIRVEALNDIFPHFWPFAIFAGITIPLIAMLGGAIHRKYLLKVDQDILIEQNPKLARFLRIIMEDRYQFPYNEEREKAIIELKEIEKRAAK